MLRPLIPATLYPLQVRGFVTSRLQTLPSRYTITVTPLILRCHNLREVNLVKQESVVMKLNYLTKAAVVVALLSTLSGCWIFMPPPGGGGGGGGGHGGGYGQGGGPGGGPR